MLNAELFIVQHSAFSIHHMAHIFSLQISDGGVPKLPIREALLSEHGLRGDRQRNLRFHGGPERAVCLLALEAILALQAEGHPIYPGSTGENITVVGLDWASLRFGDCLALGDRALIQLTSFAAPCSNIAASFSGGEFKRMSPKLHPEISRIYARVLHPGLLEVGQPV